MLGLRTPLGVDLGSVSAAVGERLWQSNQALIEQLESEDLIRIEGRRLLPTLSGLAVAEAIARRFDLETAFPPLGTGIC